MKEYMGPERGILEGTMSKDCYRVGFSLMTYSQEESPNSILVISCGLPDLREYLIV